MKVCLIMQKKSYESIIIENHKYISMDHITLESKNLMIIQNVS